MHGQGSFTLTGNQKDQDNLHQLLQLSWPWPRLSAATQCRPLWVKPLLVWENFHWSDQWAVTLSLVAVVIITFLDNDIEKFHVKLSVEITRNIKQQAATLWHTGFVLFEKVGVGEPELLFIFFSSQKIYVADLAESCRRARWNVSPTWLQRVADFAKKNAVAELAYLSNFVAELVCRRLDESASKPIPHCMSLSFATGLKIIFCQNISILEFFASSRKPITTIPEDKMITSYQIVSTYLWKKKKKDFACLKLAIPLLIA